MWQLADQRGDGYEEQKVTQYWTQVCVAGWQHCCSAVIAYQAQVYGSRAPENGIEKTSFSNGNIILMHFLELLKTKRRPALMLVYGQVIQLLNQDYKFC